MRPKQITVLNIHRKIYDNIMNNWVPFVDTGLRNYNMYVNNIIKKTHNDHVSNSVTLHEFCNMLMFVLKYSM